MREALLNLKAGARVRSHVYQSVVFRNGDSEGSTGGSKRIGPQRQHTDGNAAELLPAVARMPRPSLLLDLASSVATSSAGVAQRSYKTAANACATYAISLLSSLLAALALLDLIHTVVCTSLLPSNAISRLQNFCLMPACHCSGFSYL